MEERVTYRQLPPEEWERLRGIYRSQGDELPPAEQNTAIVAEVDGKVVGMFGVNLVVHAGPLWVAPEWRRRGIAVRMGEAVGNLVRRLGGKGFLMFPSNAGSERVAVRLGLEATGWKVYRREW